MITKFKIFEKVIVFNDPRTNDTMYQKTHVGGGWVDGTSASFDFDKYKQIYNSLKFKVGEPVKLKDHGDMIFYIDKVILGDEISHIHFYHIQDDKYIYSGKYKQFELEKLSDEEKMALKYNL